MKKKLLRPHRILFYICILLGGSNLNCDKVFNKSDNYQDVLNHYQSDSLKYTAAKFLINNLNIYYSLSKRYIGLNGKDYTDFLSTYPGNLNNNEVQDSLKVALKVSKINDTEQITSAFLISSIDQSFELNRARINPQQYSFKYFLEYVLPYRVGVEEINPWRSYMNLRYTTYLNSFNLRKMSMEKIGMIVEAEQNGSSNVLLPRMMNLTQPSINQTISDILKVRIPFSCEDYAIRLLYALRSIGIPSAYESIPLLGKFNFGHVQAAILCKDGKFYPVLRDSADHFKYQIAKMYRRTFSKQPNPYELIKATGEEPENIPSYFNMPNYIDITNERTDVSNIITTDFDHPDIRVFYLCVYNNAKWMPVEWAKFDPKSHHCIFKQMGRKILYHLAFEENGQIKLINSPLILDTIGNIKNIIGDPNLKSINLKVSNYDRHKSIDAGKAYRFYYWNEKTHGWNLHEIAKASSNFILFKNVPAGRLYKTEAIEQAGEEPVRPFTYNNNKQIWW